jgi:regulator of cell morphogenesis and NO signaling
MDNLQKYKPTDKMIDLISDNYSLLQVMSRFGLSLGFGDKTVKEVCELNGVDCRTFLIVVNFIAEGFSRLDGDDGEISIPGLIDYLRQAHIYFLDFSLPAIRRKLIEAIDCSQDDVAFLILKFFDEYTKEVRKHMEYENVKVFTYVSALLNGEHPSGFSIGVFARRHDQVNAKLTELKNIIIKYYPATGNNQLLNAVLFDVFSCEEDLASHNRVEDYLFVPAVMELEEKLK